MTAMDECFSLRNQRTKRLGRTEQIHDLSARAGTHEFRPLTAEEKNEFMSNLDTRGRLILAELAGDVKISSDPGEDVVPLCCL